MNILKEKLDKSFKDNVLSGVTVALALVPEAIAFSFVAGVDPVIGLFTAFIIGLITATLGGRPGMISGATGAIAVVTAGLVVTHGVEYLFAAVILMGLLQVLAGVFKLGKLVRMIPHPVMIGFVNGLAIVIFLAQMEHFKVGEHWMATGDLLVMGGLIALTMGIIKLFPKVTKAVPATLVSILATTVLVVALNIDTRTVGDLANISGGIPGISIPNVALSFEMLSIIFPYSLIMAIVGLTESLMTLTLIDDITNTKGDSNKECVGQGIANIVCGLFGGMGGCAMIGQSMLNIKSGGTKRLSGIAASLGLLAIILFASNLIAMIPMAALVGIMFIVVIATFEWTSLFKLKQIPRSDALVIIVVSSVTVFTNLAVSVVIGIVLSALVFAWEKGKKIESTVARSVDNKKVYHLNGPLFFASVKSFNELFDVENDPEEVIIDFTNTKVHDHSAIEAIDQLAGKYSRYGKEIYLINLSHDCANVINNAHYVNVNIVENCDKHKLNSEYVL